MPYVVPPRHIAGASAPHVVEPFFPERRLPPIQQWELDQLKLENQDVDQVKQEEQPAQEVSVHGDSSDEELINQETKAWVDALDAQWPLKPSKAPDGERSMLEQDPQDFDFKNRFGH